MSVEEALYLCCLLDKTAQSRTVRRKRVVHPTGTTVSGGLSHKGA
jgi:hypothetical protein